MREVVCWYARRWEIEVYFKTLKSGCRIEARDFEALGRERNFVAVALLLAWRVLLLCRLGRECPEIPCDVVCTPAEWKSMGMKHHEHRPWAERLLRRNLLRWERCSKGPPIWAAI
ncbi:MAG: transposase [Planctomycetaceae bacterium]